jgi:hypothetical protein
LNLSFNSFRKLIAQLPDNDTVLKNRYVALCRNIRTYSIQVLQTFAISTRRIPNEDDIKRARDEKKRLDNERIAKVALSIPGMNFNPLEIPAELEPFVQQYYQVTQFIQQAKLAGRHDEVRLLELNLKELKQAMNIA